jgi:hypothetical protein
MTKLEMLAQISVLESSITTIEPSLDEKELKSFCKHMNKCLTQYRILLKRERRRPK